MRGRTILHFTMPKVAQAPQGNSRSSPYERARRTKAWRTASAAAAEQVLFAVDHDPHTAKVNVHVEHRRTDMRRADPDNVSTVMKPIIDGLVDAGMLPDDSWRFVNRTCTSITAGCDIEMFVVTVTEAA